MSISQTLSTSSTASSSPKSITNIAAELISNIQSKFIERRNAVKFKFQDDCRLQFYGHEFEMIYVMQPTECSKCTKFILWSIKVPSCKQCKLVCHKQCLNQIDSPCRLAASSKCNSADEQQRRQLQGKPQLNHKHNFEPKQFLKPTMCKHCGTMIKGIILQGLECSCHFSVHHKCADLVCSPCNLHEGKQSESGLAIAPSDSDGKQQAATASSSLGTYAHSSRLSIEDFQLIKLIGRGSFSTVYLARLNPDSSIGRSMSEQKHHRQQQQHEEYAIKVIKKTNLVVSSDPESALTEMRALSLGRKYPFLTTAHCCFQTADRLYFVMEHVVGKDLVYHIRKSRKFTEDRARFYAAEIVLALIFLHNQGIVYRDLKLDNIILDQFGHCKLLDFGMSKELYKTDSERTRTFCGTPSYISPEIIREQEYDYSVDWWSLGVLMYEMLTGSSPFEASNEYEIYSLILKGDVFYPRSLSYRARSILEGLLTKDPQNRLGCQIMEGRALAVREHSFFLFKTSDGSESYQWGEIEAKRIRPPYRPTNEDLNSECEDAQDGDINLTPIESEQLLKVSQTKFADFSFYSDSFNSLISELGVR